MKVLLTDAIVGVGFPSLLLAVKCEEAGMAYQVSQHQWEWHRTRLEACTQEQLEELYQALREAREEAVEKFTEAEEQSRIILE